MMGVRSYDVELMVEVGVVDAESELHVSIYLAEVRP
jgi:hypothetical protein